MGLVVNALLERRVLLVLVRIANVLLVQLLSRVPVEKFASVVLIAHVVLIASVEFCSINEFYQFMVFRGHSIVSELCVNNLVSDTL